MTEEELERTGVFNRRHATTQYDEKLVGEKEERASAKGRISAATQWSDQEPPRTHSAGTQWSPVDIATMKTIPGYAGHLPGRHYVTPGKTFQKEMESVLAHFQPKSTAVNPMSRHAIPVQQNEWKQEDPYFDRRPPSTYTRNYNPIPGYQGFVPRVRTSTSSLGVRYIKAVERSLESLHAAKDERAAIEAAENAAKQEDIGTSPKKLLDQRPLHTPRHKPHPHHVQEGEEDWKALYNRPPSTYLSTTRTYIPGYKGFVPHLRGSPNAIGVRYSKAALMCLEASEKKKPQRPRTYPMKGSHQSSPSPPLPPPQQIEQSVTNGRSNGEVKNGPDEKVPAENGDSKEVEPAVNSGNQEIPTAAENRNHHPSEADRPYRQEHAYYLGDRRPSTYMTEERHPIPGYQGFIPRMRDSPSTLGLRYTKAAIKTLEDLHRMQRRDAAAAQ